MILASPPKPDRTRDQLPGLCDDGGELVSSSSSEEEEEDPQTKKSSEPQVDASSKKSSREERAAEDECSVTTAEAAAAAEESGRERLKKLRMEMTGRVWIPEMWGQESLLKDWIDSSVFDRSLVPKGLMSARSALVEECRRPTPATGG